MNDTNDIEMTSQEDAPNETQVRAYEFSFLVKTEEDVAEVTKLLASHGAEIVSEGAVRHIPLSYPIEKQNEAFFGFLHARIAADHAKAIEKEAQLNKTILRFLLVLLPRTPQPAPPRPRGERPEPGAVPSLVSDRDRAASPRPVDPAVLSNEELEKKIEEILA
jgi:ribosomal protein S6